jgi:hypothetical protein
VKLAALGFAGLAVAGAAAPPRAFAQAARAAANMAFVASPQARAAETAVLAPAPAPAQAAAAATAYVSPAALLAAANAAYTAPAAQPTAPAGLGNLQAVTGAGDLRYRWQRDGLTLELRDRHGSWTEHEATQVRDALDQLPDLYVRKAIAGGAHQIYRDGALPQAPYDFFLPPPAWRHAVTVPCAPWYYIAVGDNLFAEDDFLVYRVIAHELGHAIQWGISGWLTISAGTGGWTSISWTTGVPTLGMRSWNGFVTDYARTNHMEDFAESAKYYWINPDALAQVNPAKYAFMRDVVFEGLVSPPEARSDRIGLPATIVPTIASLGASHDDWSSEVTVHGNYFMAPFDGGFNAVHYGGTEAYHLPASHNTVYSWVPWIGAGEADVTVTTEDGTSNAAPFTVETPWWKFW